MRGPLFAAFVLLSAWTLADHNPTHIAWMHPAMGEVRISSSEELWLGRTYRHYPLHYLVDGNHATAWVFKGDLDAHKRYRQEFSEAPIQADRILPHFQGNHSVAFEFERPVLLDEVRLVAGYAKNSGVFARNRRVRDLRVTVNNSQTSAHRLKDTDMMQAVRVRTEEAYRIELTLDGFYEGTERDICLSEVEFYYRGNRIELALPEWVASTDGSECCESDVYLVNRHGIRKAFLGAVLQLYWSPDGCIVGSLIPSELRTERVVVANVALGRMLLNQRVEDATDGNQWIEYDGSKVFLQSPSGRLLIYDPVAED